MNSSVFAFLRRQCSNLDPVPGSWQSGCCRSWRASGLGRSLAFGLSLPTSDDEQADALACAGFADVSVVLETGGLVLHRGRK
jgi:hypothetical protein